MGQKEYVRWKVKERDLRGMSPERARDLVVECFFEARKETFRRAGDRLGKPMSDEALRATVTGAVRLAFSEAGGAFDRSDAATLQAVVGVLARKASSWGTPPDVIEHHKGEVERILRALGAAPPS